MIVGNNKQPTPSPLPPSARTDAKAQQVLAALTRGKAHASPVGMGVHKQYVAPAEKPVPPTAEDVKLGEGWSDKASLKDQVQRGPDYWKLDRIEVQIFDLSNDELLKSYNVILTKANLPDSNIVIMQNERKFNDKTGNWMALVELQYILYRKILITEKNQDEQAS